MHNIWEKFEFRQDRTRDNKLPALERLKNTPIDLSLGKLCCFFFSAVFDRNKFILASNDDIYKGLDEFEIRPVPAPDYRDSCG